MTGTAKSTVPSDKEEVEITFVKTKDGKKRTIPVWFTVNGGKMELLPMYGLRTRWYVDVQKSGEISLKIEDWEKDAKPDLVRDSKAVDGIKGRFASKYGEGRVKKYYPTSEVAFEIGL